MITGSVYLVNYSTRYFSLPDSTDSMVLSISHQAIVDAGPDTTICESAGSLTLLNATTSYAHITVVDEFRKRHVQQCGHIEYYLYPSATDILNGSVVLTLTANSVSPCVTVSDQMTLHITKQAFANAGPDEIICETQGSYQLVSTAAGNYVSILWITSGTGTFNDPSQIAPVYTPSTSDIISGSVNINNDSIWNCTLCRLKQFHDTDDIPPSYCRCRA